jgi:guanine deaminase
MWDHDPSAHAEVHAIREACRKVGSPNIAGAVLYSSCEPCPMCYSTAYWAPISKVFYAAAWTDYAELFDNSVISTDMSKPYAQRKVAFQQILHSPAMPSTGLALAEQAIACRQRDSACDVVDGVRSRHRCAIE